MRTKLTDILGIIYRDLHTILQKMTPQALALSRHERSQPLLYLSAAEMLASPSLPPSAWTRRARPRWVVPWWPSAKAM